MVAKRCSTLATKTIKCPIVRLYLTSISLSRLMVLVCQRLKVREDSIWQIDIIEVKKTMDEET